MVSVEELMKYRRLLRALMAGLFASWLSVCDAQSEPDTVRSAAPRVPLVVGPIEADAGGFHRTHRAKERVEMLDSASSYVRQGSRSDLTLTCQMPAPYEMIGGRQESKGRATFLAEYAGRKLMVTYTYFPDIGERAIFAPEMLNATVQGSPAILSLLVSIPKTERALWLLTWQDKDGLFELYLDDNIAKVSAPTLTRGQVIILAEKVGCGPYPLGRSPATSRQR